LSFEAGAKTDHDAIHGILATTAFANQRLPQHPSRPSVSSEVPQKSLANLTFHETCEKRRCVRQDSVHATRRSNIPALTSSPQEEAKHANVTEQKAYSPTTIRVEPPVILSTYSLRQTLPIDNASKSMAMEDNSRAKPDTPHLSPEPTALMLTMEPPSVPPFDTSPRLKAKSILRRVGRSVGVKAVSKTTPHLGPQMERTGSALASPIGTNDKKEFEEKKNLERSTSDKNQALPKPNATEAVNSRYNIQELP
jgi:hypothetical protein